MLLDQEHDYEETQELPTTHNDKQAFMAKVMQKKLPPLSALINNTFHIGCDGKVVSMYFDVNHANLITLMKTPRNKELLGELIREFYGPNMTLRYYITENPDHTKASEADAALKAKVSSHPIVKHILDHYNGSIISCQVMQKQNKNKKEHSS